MRFIAVLFCLQFLPVVSVQAEFDHSYARLNEVLNIHVDVQGSKSSVDYRALKGGRESLDQFISTVEQLPKKTFQSFSKNQQMAFLVNAYNALTLKLIIDSYPVASIKELGSFFSTAWKKRFFSLFGSQQHLDFIEHELLRKNYNESRIHFALVCASKGCPPLRNEAYTHDRLDFQLQEAAFNFLNDTDRNYYKNGTLYLSKIFKWFSEDFTSSSPSVPAYVAQYMKGLEPALAEKASVSYLPYDWTLNAK